MTPAPATRRSDHFETHHHLPEAVPCLGEEQRPRYLKELTPERLAAWQPIWKDEALAASKKDQRVSASCTSACA